MEDFVSFEIAKKLKEKGFNEFCYMYFDIEGKLYQVEEYDAMNSGITISSLLIKNICKWAVMDCTAPTISQVLKWLRKEKDIYVQIEYINNEHFGSVIIRCSTGGVIASYKDDKFHYSDSETLSREKYEQAALAGVEYVIDNLI